MLHKAFIILFILLLSSFAISAQELPEDANACDEGGAMEGKCNVDFNGDGEISDYEVTWAWTCGWYMIRYDAGVFNDVPVFCQSLLPSEIETQVESGTFLCSVDLAAYGFSSVDGIHNSVGFDIWETDDDGFLDISDDEFLYWSESSGGYPPCDLSGGA